jgi:hypothetical protein
MADDHAGERWSDRIAGFDFDTRHGKKVRQFFRAQRRIDQGAKPALGKLHGFSSAQD